MHFTFMIFMVLPQSRDWDSDISQLSVVITSQYPAVMYFTAGFWQAESMKMLAVKPQVMIMWCLTEWPYCLVIKLPLPIVIKWRLSMCFKEWGKLNRDEFQKRKCNILSIYKENILLDMNGCGEYNKTSQKKWLGYREINEFLKKGTIQQNVSFLFVV